VFNKTSVRISLNVSGSPLCRVKSLDARTRGRNGALTYIPTWVAGQHGGDAEHEAQPHRSTHRRAQLVLPAT